MRIAVISDIHGNLPALEAVLADLRPRAPDLIVNLGDLVSAPLWPKETLELLRTVPGPVIRGNHDRWLAERSPDELGPTNRYVHHELSAADRAELGKLPHQLEVAPGVVAVHGTPYRDTEYLLEEVADLRLARAPAGVVEARLGDCRAELVLCGHSHAQHSAAATERTLVVNPGSVGCPRRVDAKLPDLVEAGSPHARYAVTTRRPHGWMIELLAVPYDVTGVVARARQHRRHDWAAAFLGQVFDA